MTSFQVELPIWSQMTEMLYTHRVLIFDRTMNSINLFDLRKVHLAT